MQKEKRFEIVYQEGGFMSAKTIYVDKETGVNYLFSIACFLSSSYIFSRYGPSIVSLFLVIK